MLEAALSTRGVTGLLSCPGDPASLTFSGCQGAEMAPEKGSPFLGVADAAPAADPRWDLGQIP